jgi:ketosteroid isomerase-like protein
VVPNNTMRHALPVPIGLLSALHRPIRPLGKPKRRETSMKQSTANSAIAAVMDAVRQGLLKRDERVVAEAYAPDAVIFDLAPPLAHSIDVEQLATWLKSWGGPVDQKLQDFKFTVNDDLAVGHGVFAVGSGTVRSS